MTGFGRQVATIPGKTLTLELKTVNSKGLDVNIRMPAWLREKEIEIRGMLSLFVRGKADLFITSEVTGTDNRYAINQPLALHYHAVLRGLQREFGEENGPLLPLILQMPDILSSGPEVVDPGEWGIIRQHLEEVIRITDQFREEEGAALKKDLQKQNLMVQFISNILSASLKRNIF